MRAQLLQTHARSRPALQLVAVHVHVGSQITTLEPLRARRRVVADLAVELQRAGLPARIRRPRRRPRHLVRRRPRCRRAARLRRRRWSTKSGRPGCRSSSSRAARSSAPAGALLARVIDVKPRTAASEFVVIDAGMTELMRPALYGAFHRIEPVVRRRRGDAPLRHRRTGLREQRRRRPRRELPPLDVGDLVAIRDAGAYGSAMASNYNRRPLPAEVLVDDGTWRVIRRRQWNWRC